MSEGGVGDESKRGQMVQPVLLIKDFSETRFRFLHQCVCACVSVCLCLSVCLYCGRDEGGCLTTWLCLSTPQ